MLSLQARITPPRRLEAGSFDVWAYARPCENDSPGGDRIAVASTPAGLLFLVADAAGHGRAAEPVWDAAEPAVSRSWDALVHSWCELVDLKAFATGLNDALYELGLHLCVAAGALGTDGRLRVATCGYGVHVLASGPDGPDPPDEPRELFGLKLGWLPTADWAANLRGFVGLEIADTSDVVVLTDGFLGEDHRDPAATLRFVRELGRACHGLSPRDAVDHVRALPHDADDASVLAVRVPAAP